MTAPADGILNPRLRKAAAVVCKQNRVSGFNSFASLATFRSLRGQVSLCVLTLLLIQSVAGQRWPNCKPWCSSGRCRVGRWHSNLTVGPLPPWFRFLNNYRSVSSFRFYLLYPGDRGAAKSLQMQRNNATAPINSNQRAYLFRRREVGLAST